MVGEEAGGVDGEDLIGMRCAVYRGVCKERLPLCFDEHHERKRLGCIGGVSCPHCSQASDYPRAPISIARMSPVSSIVSPTANANASSVCAA